MVYGVSAALLRPEGGLIGGYVGWQMTWRVSVHPDESQLPRDLWPEYARYWNPGVDTAELTVEVNGHSAGPGHEFDLSTF